MSPTGAEGSEGSEMTFIEGVGDEVLIVGGLLLSLMVIMLAWMSTRVRDYPATLLITRQVVVTERQTPTLQQAATTSGSAQADLINTAEEIVDEIIGTLTGDDDDLVDSEDHETSFGGSAESSPDGASASVEGTNNMPDGETGDKPDGEVVDKARSETVDSEKTVPDNETTDVPNVETLGREAADDGNELRRRNVASAGTETVENDRGTSGEGASDESREEQGGLSSQLIKIKVKFFNDVQKQVEARQTDTIGHFKRTHFATELASNKLVKLIYHGQLLGDDGQTLAACRVQDGSVLHCLVREQPQQDNNQNNAGARGDIPEGLDMGAFMMPLLFVMLAAAWYIRLTYKHLFTGPATLGLLGLTFLFAFGLFSYFRPNRQPLGRT